MKATNKKKNILKPFRPFNANPLSPSSKKKNTLKKSLKTKSDD